MMMHVMFVQSDVVYVNEYVMFCVVCVVTLDETTRTLLKTSPVCGLKMRDEGEELSHLGGTKSRVSKRMRCFGHLVGMSAKQPLRGVFWTGPIRRTSQGRTRIHWGDNIARMARDCLSVTPVEL